MTGQPPSSVSLETLDKERVLHPATSIADHLRTGPRIMAEGAGLTLTDTAGRRYLDAVAGLWCVAIGYGRTEVAEAMAAQSRRLAFYHTFTSMSNEPQIRLADRLLALAPGRMSKVFFGTSGSEANDTQVKLVWYYNNLRGRPRKKKIIARRDGFHGTTVAAASLTGIEAFHRAFDLPLPQILHTSPAYHYRHAAPGQSEEDYASALAAELEQLIEREGPDTVAAFIAEPVMGAGGVVPPPRGYFEKIQRVLRRYDVLMIADEVICGFGRLGRMFGSEVYGIEPDLVTVAKQLTSGYFPLSACFVSEEIWNALREGSSELGPFAHGFTYSGHPVGAAAALANLDIVLGEDLVGNAARVGPYLQECCARNWPAIRWWVTCAALASSPAWSLSPTERRVSCTPPSSRSPRASPKVAWRTGLSCGRCPGATSSRFPLPSASPGSRWMRLWTVWRGPSNGSVTS
jgi:L-2,4-diaminobutyrate transaminase